MTYENSDSDQPSPGPFAPAILDVALHLVTFVTLRPTNPPRPQATE